MFDPASNSTRPTRSFDSRSELPLRVCLVLGAVGLLAGAVACAGPTLPAFANPPPVEGDRDAGSDSLEDEDSGTGEAAD